MSKNEYFNKPSGPPPNYGNQPATTTQPNYSQQTQDRGMYSHNQQQQQGYHQQPQQGYYQQGPPPQGQYYQHPQQPYYQPQQQQQQPMYVQQQPKSGGTESCLMGCLAALCVCCTLDMLF